MSILLQFEHLAAQAIFPSNKEAVRQSIGLHDVFRNKHNQQIRSLLSDDSERFADMSRIVK